MKTSLRILLIGFLISNHLFAQQKLPSKRCNVLAYYAGDASQIDNYNVSQLTHILFSFTHLKGNGLHVENKKDSATITKLVSLKKKFPALKIILSMGGWGGCESCSAVFNTKEGREEFALSAKQLLRYFGADGIDLDWEYPAIEGFPKHQFLPADKPNFTALITEMRRQFGSRYEISLAAGGFTQYLLQSIEWNKIMPLVNRVNLMTYDLVNGYATVSGHHTPLYASAQQKESIDNAVHLLDSMGVPLCKLAIGAAFYARVFKVTDTLQNGLYQPCTFYKGIDYKELIHSIATDSNYVYHWDSAAHAPYYFNAKERLLVSFDDKKSVAEKTQYVLDKGLDGVMFWELTNDVCRNGLLQSVDDARHHNSGD